MELANTVVNTFVVAAVGAILAWLGNARFNELRAEIRRLSDDVDRRFAQVDRRFEEIERRIDAFQRSLDSMRSDLTNVALAVGASPRASGQEH